MNSSICTTCDIEWFSNQNLHRKINILQSQHDILNDQLLKSSWVWQHSFLKSKMMTSVIFSKMIFISSKRLYSILTSKFLECRSIWETFNHLRLSTCRILSWRKDAKATKTRTMMINLCFERRTSWCTKLCSVDEAWKTTRESNDDLRMSSSMSSLFLIWENDIDERFAVAISCKLENQL